MKAFVYFNLHTGLWSVKALDGFLKGKVVGHAYNIRLTDAEFRVSEAGRQRVLKEQKKNVHAGVVGTIAGIKWSDIRYEWNEDDYPGLWDLDYPEDNDLYEKWIQNWDIVDDAQMITYNPYKYSTFVDVKTKEPVHESSQVWMTMDYTGRSSVHAI